MPKSPLAAPRRLQATGQAPGQSALPPEHLGLPATGSCLFSLGHRRPGRGMTSGPVCQVHHPEKLDLKLEGVWGLLPLKRGKGKWDHTRDGQLWQTQEHGCACQEGACLSRPSSGAHPHTPQQMFRSQDPPGPCPPRLCARTPAGGAQDQHKQRAGQWGTQLWFIRKGVSRLAPTGAALPHPARPPPALTPHPRLPHPGL